MKHENEIKELRKGCRRSRQAIPVEAGLLILAVALLWLLSRFVAVPLGVTIIVVSMSVFVLVGDILNLYFSGRRLRKLEKTFATNG